MQKTAPTIAREPAGRVPHRRYLSLGIDVAGLSCLVVGGGRVGARKARTLADAGARVTVLSPDIHHQLRPLVADGCVEWCEATFDPRHLDGHALVVAATDDPALNVRIGRDAEARGILSCLVSPGRESRVIFPATHDREDVTVAVHTNGRDCTRSRRVRDEIARMLERGEQPCERLAVFGLTRRGVPPPVFERLRHVDISRNELGGMELVVVSTCQRWECYFVAPSPRPVIQDILRLVQQRTGLLLDAYRPAPYTKSGVAAFHHLLRVASGLESPLLGETEIVGQIRRSLADATLSEGSPIGRACISALRAQRSIRKEAGLDRGGASWARAAVAFLEDRLGALDDRRVLLLGCGRLSKSIATELRRKRAVPVPFSRRARTSGVAWCRELGLRAHDPAELDQFLPDADAAVLSSRPDAADALHGADGLLVLDLTGDNLSEIGRLTLSGQDAERAAKAGRLAYAHALQLDNRRSHPRHPPVSLRVGARGSRLSRAQFNELSGFLTILLPDTRLEFVPIDTPGDRDKATPLPNVRDDNFFTRDVDLALVRGEVDLALHSAKDLPEQIPAGLRVAAVTPAFAPWESLVSRDGLTLAELPTGARVGTSSDRRREALLKLRPDLVPCDVRGNVPDRIRQLDEGKYDALVLAAVGPIRLGLTDRIAHVFSPDEFPSPPGQGSLALVVREDDAGLLELLAPLDLGDRRGLPWA